VRTYATACSSTPTNRSFISRQNRRGDRRRLLICIHRTTADHRSRSTIAFYNRDGSWKIYDMRSRAERRDDVHACMPERLQKQNLDALIESMAQETARRRRGGPHSERQRLQRPPDGVFELSGRMTFQTVPQFLTRTAMCSMTPTAQSRSTSASHVADSAGVAPCSRGWQQARIAGVRSSSSAFPSKSASSLTQRLERCIRAQLSLVSAGNRDSGLHKRYSNVHALKGIDLTIDRGRVLGCSSQRRR